MESFDSVEIRAEDLIRRCEKQYTAQFTHFLTSEEQEKVKRIAFQHPDVFVLFVGGFANAERCVAGFFHRDIYDETDVEGLAELAEIEYVEIMGSGFVNINHRDVLGSLMSLGIKRETLGDIIVSDDARSAYVAVISGMGEYLCLGLERVARDKVRVSVTDAGRVPEKKQKFSDMSLTLASVRIDAALSGVLGISRDKAKKLVASGRVAVNHTVILNSDKEFSQGDIITVKGEGKFLVDAFLGLTAKNRYRIVFRKYL